MMNALDRLHYYENFYDSFCSEFAIPRVHISTSFQRPSSTFVDSQFTTTSSQRNLVKNQNGNGSNHFYYFDSLSDAFSPEDSKGIREKETFSRSRIAQQIFSEENNGSDGVDVDQFLDEDIDIKPKQDYVNSVTMQYPMKSEESPRSGKKGPTPPPKPLKLKLLSVRDSTCYPTSTLYRNSNPDLPRDELKSSCYHNMALENKTPSKFIHASFESVHSAPPPPKHIQAVSPYTRHMSCDILPNFSFHENNSQLLNRKVSQPSYTHRSHTSPPSQHRDESSEKKRDALSLSDFLKLTSNTVFKKPPFGRKERLPAEYMSCGHPRNGTAASSPTPSNSSEKPSRSSVVADGTLLPFRKKCGVTKRRKKIDELLFTPTGHHSQSSSNMSTCSGEPVQAETPGKYPISPGNNPISMVPPSSSIFVAETNHDTEFELDPLPEKDCDDVLDFSWAMSPQAQDHEMTSTTNNKVQDGSGRKQRTRKTSSSSNGRPSSRCSLIINTLMGHLNLGKAEEEQHHHQYSADGGNHNNNFVQQDDRHQLQYHHKGHTHHFHSPPEQDAPRSNDSKEITKSKPNKKPNNRKTSQLFRSCSKISKKKFHDDPDGPNKITYSKTSPTANCNGSSNNPMNSSPPESDHIINASGHNPYQSISLDDDHDEYTAHQHHHSENGKASGHTTYHQYGMSRSITAFNLGNDEEYSTDCTKNIFCYPAKTHPNEVLYSTKRNNNRNKNERSGLNVIGCIPRVSLQNSKGVQQQKLLMSSDVFLENQNQNQLKPQFQIGSNNLIDQDGKNLVVSCPSNVTKEGTCCRNETAGIFYEDSQQSLDKYDKYYGQYSLTGLNIESLDKYSYNANSKSAEELILDRYYAHCNKVIRNKAKKKLKKRSYSLPEKIWKNVVPIINSANNNNSNNNSGEKRKPVSQLCGHLRSKQIEECTHCLQEQTKQNRQSLISLSRKENKNRRVGTVHAPLMNKTVQDSTVEVERDLDPERGGESFGIKLERFRVGHNNNQIEKFKTRTKKYYVPAGKFQEEEQDVIEEFSSSSCFSYSGHTVNPTGAKRKMKKKSCASSGISCRNTTTSSSSSTSDDEHCSVSSRDHNFPIGAQVDEDCVVHNYEDDQDDGIESSGKVALENASRAGGRRLAGNSNNNQGALQLLESERGGGGEDMHLGKLKRGCVKPSSNPIRMQSRSLEKVIIEDSSSTISSLPTNTNRDRKQTEEDKLKKRSNGISAKKDAGGDCEVEALSPKKNHVKWTFLTSGLAKATRRLSGSSRSSSMSSFTTCSSSGDYTGSRERIKESGNHYVSLGKVELLEKKGKKMVGIMRVDKKNDKDASRNDEEKVARLRVKERDKLLKKRRNTAEVYLNEDNKSGRNSVGLGILTENGTHVVTRESCRSHGEKQSKGVLRSGSLKRKPSYNTKRRFSNVQVLSPIPPVRKKRAEKNTPSETLGVFMRKKPVRLPPTARAVSVPAARAFARVDGHSVFSAFSNSSCNSSTSGSNRSSSSGYTSNVSKKTQKFLTNFRKKWAKKNNKVADGDEETAGKTLKEDDDTDEDEERVTPPQNPKRNSFLSRSSVTRTSLVRRRSHASKQAIFSTFYSGPLIKDPMEEEKIYVTKDFDDVVLNLESGEVKKTSDGTILFTADSVSFNFKDPQKSKTKNSKKDRTGKEEKSEKTGKSHHGRDLLQLMKKKSPTNKTDAFYTNNEEVMITANPSNEGTHQKKNKKLFKKMEAEVVHFLPGKISKRVSASAAGGLIKSYLGISKKDLAKGDGRRNGKVCYNLIKNSLEKEKLSQSTWKKIQRLFHSLRLVQIRSRYAWSVVDRIKKDTIGKTTSAFKLFTGPEKNLIARNMFFIPFTFHYLLIESWKTF